MNMNTQETVNDSKLPSLEGMAYTLYDTLGRYCDKGVPTRVRVWSPQGDFCHLFEIEELLGLSEADILHLLQSPDESRCIRF